MRGFSAMRATLISNEKSTFGRLDAAGDRRGGAVVRRRGERHMALAAQQAGRRIEPDPAGAGQIDLGPGVQIGEIASAPAGPSSAFMSGLSWIEIAGDETRREAEMAQDLHQQPRAVAA